jgi:hypothetical protein
MAQRYYLCKIFPDYIIQKVNKSLFKAFINHLINKTNVQYFMLRQSQKIIGRVVNIAFD